MGGKVPTLPQRFQHHLATQGVTKQDVRGSTQHVAERVGHILCCSGQCVWGVQARDRAGFPVVAQVEEQHTPWTGGGVGGWLDGTPCKAAPVAALA